MCGGIPARLYRISFSGELAYEIGVPARYGDALAARLMEVGAPFGIAPYGTEALGVMRIEKGHVAGNELDGRTTARDLGLGRMMSTKKDCIGRVMAGRPALLDPDRPSFVGFKPVDAAAAACAPARISCRAARAQAAANDQGVITSVAFSPSLGHWIGLGLLARGPQRIGEMRARGRSGAQRRRRGRGLRALLHRPERRAAACLSTSLQLAPGWSISRYRAATAGPMAARA